jgi:hypothetical protein
MCLRDMKYIGFKYQRENKQNSDKENFEILAFFCILPQVPDYCASLQSRIPPVLVSGCIISGARNFIR